MLENECGYGSLFHTEGKQAVVSGEISNLSSYRGGTASGNRASKGDIPGTAEGKGHQQSVCGGIIGMEWIVKRSSELYVSSSGLSKASDQFGYGCPFLSYKDVFLTRTSETTNELGMSCVERL